LAHHPLAKELELTPDDILDVIANARRLKMAVRGWVAEKHLRETLSKVPGITCFESIEQEGALDLAYSAE